MPAAAHPQCAASERQRRAFAERDEASARRPQHAQIPARGGGPHHTRHVARRRSTHKTGRAEKHPQAWSRTWPPVIFHRRDFHRRLRLASSMAGCAVSTAAGSLSIPRWPAPASRPVCRRPIQSNRGSRRGAPRLRRRLGWLRHPGVSTPANGNRKCGGRTPIMVYVAPDKTAVLPAILRVSRRTRRRHNSALISGGSTGAPPGASSPARKPRPRWFHSPESAGNWPIHGRRAG